MKHVETLTRKVSTATPAANVTPAAVPLLFLRAEQVLQLLPVSRRTISNWQRTRRIKFYRVGRTVLFKRSDIDTCLEKFAVNPVGEMKARKDGTITAEPKTVRKRHMRRIEPEAGV